MVYYNGENMLSDVQIAQQAVLKPMSVIAEELGLTVEDLHPFGNDKAKVVLDVLKKRADDRDGKLILVTAITPTPAGEGKTTTTVGLGDALRQRGKKVCIAIREPSLGPCFGVKGGAAGGGYAQVIPMVDINLHFTGDFHAITTAHNLLSAMLDNHLHQGNALDIDLHTITWKRVLDMNDRALREVVIGLGGKANGIPHESGFEITTASEIMALLCLARDRADLEKRLSDIVVAFNRKGKPVTASDLSAAGAMSVVLKDALMPNLVQTLEGTPAFVHGGPFGNIAHGCNSAIATRMALKLADYVVTEAGFGSDLGAEKFFDIKCRTAGLSPSAAVVVATVRALKMHGGTAMANLKENDPAALRKGIQNLEKHCENVRTVGLNPIVAINRFPTDTDEEIKVLQAECARIGVQFSLSEVWEKGGAGGLELADMVMKAADKKSYFHYSYPLEITLKEKILRVAQQFYGAENIFYTPVAEKQLANFEELGFGQLPICIAKTQSSLSDDAKLLGRPRGFTMTVREAKVSAGAGFVVIYAGTVMTMPGLPKSPSAEKIGMNEDGEVYGLF
jgi:formate--tetrahydrofolate ligase